MSITRPIARPITQSTARALTAPGVGGGALTPNLFVDSVNGSDSNDGLTELTAKQTIAGLPALSSGDVIGLARGSYWREQLNIGADNIGLTSYGTGAMPVLDGADVAGTWTQPDAGTYPNVWAQSWTRGGVASTTTSSAVMGLWADGVRPRYAASVADLQTNGGWFASSLTTTGAATIYIKSLTDPNTSGVLYEIGKRDYAINSQALPLTGVRAGLRASGPIEAKRYIGHNNALCVGPTFGKRMLLRDGNIHHATVQSDLLEDIVSSEYSPNIAPSVYVAFRPAGAGFTPVFRRLLALMPGGVSRVTGSNSAFYAHSTVSREVTSASYEGCLSRGLNCANASAQLLTVTGCYAEDIYQTGVSDGSVLSVINAFMTRDTGQTPLAAGNAAISRLATSGTFTATNCAIYNMKGGAIRNAAGGTKPTITNCSVSTSIGTAFTGGECDLRYSVFAPASRTMDLLTTSYTGDYNVFAFMGQPNPQFQYNGTVYSTLASFQAASGQDANSVFLKAADQVSGNGIAFWLGVSSGANNGPADGDFRINPSAKVYSGDGTAYTGTFPDGTLITLAGPQQHWDFNQRKLLAGPPSRYPVLPASIEEMRTYVENPAGWNFYP